MIVLGIDQSLTSSGWCIKQDGIMTKYGLVTSDKNKDKFTRMMDISQELLNILPCPDLIIIEGLPFGSSFGSSSRDLAGLQAIIVGEFLKAGYKLDKDLFLPAPTTVKKLATGSGRAQKNDMFESLPPEIKEKFISTPKTRGRFDITDAFWLASYGESLNGK